MLAAWKSEKRLERRTRRPTDEEVINSKEGSAERADDFYFLCFHFSQTTRIYKVNWIELTSTPERASGWKRVGDIRELPKVT